MDKARVSLTKIFFTIISLLIFHHIMMDDDVGIGNNDVCIYCKFGLGTQS